MSIPDLQGVQWGFAWQAVDPLGKALRDGSIDAQFENFKSVDMVVRDEICKGYDLMARAVIYAERIDKLLQGDDGEETFLERLSDDLARYEASGRVEA